MSDIDRLWRIYQQRGIAKVIDYVDDDLAKLRARVAELEKELREERRFTSKERDLGDEQFAFRQRVEKRCAALTKEHEELCAAVRRLLSAWDGGLITGFDIEPFRRLVAENEGAGDMQSSGEERE